VDGLSEGETLGAGVGTVGLALGETLGLVLGLGVLGLLDGPSVGTFVGGSCG